MEKLYNNAFIEEYFNTVFKPTLLKPLKVIEEKDDKQVISSLAEINGQISQMEIKVSNVYFSTHCADYLINRHFGNKSWPYFVYNHIGENKKFDYLCHWKQSTIEEFFAMGEVEPKNCLHEGIIDAKIKKLQEEINFIDILIEKERIKE